MTQFKKTVLFLPVLFFTAYMEESITLSPQKTVELALARNATVKISELSVTAEEYGKKSAFTAFLPKITGNAGATHLIDKPQMEFGGGEPVVLNMSVMDAGDLEILKILNAFSNLKIETPDNIYNVGISAGLPLFTGGKILNSYRMAKYSHTARKFSHEWNLTEIAFYAQQAFWGYVTALKSQESIIETRRWFEKLVHDQQKMYENGMIIELDVLNSRIQVDNFRLGEEKTGNLITTVGGNLLFFLGLPRNTRIEADTSALLSIDTVFVIPSADSIETIVENRSDIKALACQLEMLQSLKKIQMGSCAPTVAGFASLGYNNQYSATEGNLKRSSSVGVSLDWPIVDWGKAVYETRKVDCQIRTLELKLNSDRETARLKIAELSRKIDETKKAFAVAWEDVAIATKALDIARKKYDAQLITNLELLNTRNQLTSKMMAYTQARIAAILAIEEFKTEALSSSNAPSAQ